ncbi:unnamed protein product [Ixodes pacificus]
MSEMSGVESQGTLVINPVGENKTEPAGKGFVLFCKGNSGDADYTDFKWTGPNNQEILGGPDMQVISTDDSYILSFDKPSPQDSGTYTCSALYGNTIRLTISVHITFYRESL